MLADAPVEPASWLPRCAIVDSRRRARQPAIFPAFLLQSQTSDCYNYGPCRPACAGVRLSRSGAES